MALQCVLLGVGPDALAHLYVRAATSLSYRSFGSGSDVSKCFAKELSVSRS